MGLAAEGGLDGLEDVTEGGWVCGVLECPQENETLTGGQVELAGGVLDNVGADDAVDLFAEWLDGD